MAKITLPTVTGGYNITQINSNFQRIATAMETGVYWRTNPASEPNQLTTPMDTNGQRIYNLPAPTAQSEPVRLQEFQKFNTDLTAISAAAQQAVNTSNQALSQVQIVQSGLDGKAPLVHTHLISQVTGLQTALNEKAPAVHTHSISQIASLQTVLDGKAPVTHTHTIAQVTGLQAAIDGKAPTVHNHTIAQVTGLQSALDGKQPAGSYAPAVHTHTIAQVTNLQATLDGKAPVVHTHTLEQVVGLLVALDDKSDVGHTHEISEVNGLQPELDSLNQAIEGKQDSLPPQLPGGTRYLREDMTWATPASGGGGASGVSSFNGRSGDVVSQAGDYAVAQITGLDTALAGKANSSHTHTIAQVTGLQAALDSKSTPADNTWANTLNKPAVIAAGATAAAARDAIGLKSAALQEAGDFEKKITVTNITADTTGVAQRHYVFTAVATLTMPANPVAGDVVEFTNAAPDKVYIDWNGKTVKGVTPEPEVMVVPQFGQAVVKFNGSTWA